jgi:nucleotide-binding universal stress UspA family protein
MAENILIPLDGSELFEETHGYLRELAMRSGARCILLHVIENADYVDSDDGLEPSDHHCLRPYADALVADGIPFTCLIRVGDAVTEISRMALEQKASMILMSTHGRQGLDNIREGSVTERVVRQSPCPVFVLHSVHHADHHPEFEQLFKRMLVPLDGSEVSASILPCVRKLAGMFGTEVVLFHDDLDHESAQTAKVLRENIESVGVTLANDGIPVRLDYATHHRPVHEIVNRADELNIDLLAMTTHGQGGRRRPLEDSVTANVMRHTDRPLIVCSSDPQCVKVC